MDTRSPEQRRRIMKSVRQINTGPELAVRRICHALGYRFRLYRKDLPGKPDIVFPRLRKIIFVNGCFWHGHDCRKGQLPKSNQEFWIKKIRSNIDRDIRVWQLLTEADWEVLTLWQCQLEDQESLKSHIHAFLSSG